MSPDEQITVPLVRIACGRSGDKGDISNIGLMARHPHLLPVLRALPVRVSASLLATAAAS